MLQKGATVYEAMNKADFQRHAACHAINWYKYMLNDGLDVSNGSLYFVTECIKSVNWGIAVFYANPIAEDHLRFIADEGSCRWERCGKVEARVGPNPKDIASDDDEPNQCVFLRGFKIMLRSDIWDELNSSVAVTSQDGELSSSSPSTRTANYPIQGKAGRQTDSLHESSSNNSTTTSHSYGTRLQASQLMDIRTLPGGLMVEACASGPEGSSNWLGQVVLEEIFREESPVCLIQSF